MRKIVFTTMLLSFYGVLQAQMSLMVGPSMIKSFGTEGVFPGFHFGMEMVQDDIQTYYARFTFSPSRTFETSTGTVAIAKDINTIPYSIQLDGREKFNFTSIEVGKRYYFGEGFDSGFSPYGGTSIQGIFNKVKLSYSDFDQDKYEVESANDGTSGSIFGIFFGLTGGVKKSFYFGTIYFDAGMSYALFAVPSNNIAGNSENYRSLLFNFNLGFRKDFY